MEKNLKTVPKKDLTLITLKKKKRNSKNKKLLSNLFANFSKKSSVIKLKKFK